MQNLKFQTMNVSVDFAKNFHHPSCIREKLFLVRRFYTVLRNYHQLKGLVYTQSTESIRITYGLITMLDESTRITYGLITMLNESQSDCDTALTLLRNARPSTSDAVSSGSAVNNITPAYSSEPSSNIANSMATRFKADKKFTGKLGEDLTEYISNYMDAANDYNLSAKQELDYMHHLLDGCSAARANVVLRIVMSTITVVC
jgi:hypothetical protein